MDRRLYFLIPDRQHALSIVDELVEHGIDKQHIHALGDPRTRLDGLPIATPRQKNDVAKRVEKTCWNLNLASFTLALIALITLPIVHGPSWWLLIPAVIMIGNFMFGLRMTSIPSSHLGEFRDALTHGEILLLVDVPETQVADVETRIHQQHPEAAVGGVSWSTQAFGL
jgi:hypothetical protein